MLLEDKQVNTDQISLLFSKYGICLRGSIIQQHHFHLTTQKFGHPIILKDTITKAFGKSERSPQPRRDELDC